MSNGRVQSPPHAPPSLPTLAPDSHSFSPISPFGLTWHQCDWILNSFLQSYLPKFPFLAFDAKPTARTLLTEKPFLFRAVMFVASPHPVSRRFKVRRDLMAYMSQRLLVEDENNMDLLQGSLVITIW